MTWFGILLILLWIAVILAVNYNEKKASRRAISIAIELALIVGTLTVGTGHL